MNSNQLTELATSALEDLKGIDIQVLDIRDKTSIADVMLIATGTSMRHVRSLANEVKMQVKAKQNIPLSVEGDDRSDWVLIDLGDVIVHVMTQEKRDFYALEKLWSVAPGKASEEPADTLIATS
ncbi:MAG: ribosome silencing factor [Gammaproteobacteria bacterium]|nr:ribosome silencing factor [Gammaproteobacteria bacterium]